MKPSPLASCRLSAWAIVSTWLVLAACGSVGGSDGDPILCTAPETACGEVCVNLSNDNNHCGECNNVCTAGLVCGNGDCSSTCPVDQSTCDGHCVNTEVDESNCGACGTTCDTATEECRGGDCVPRCDSFLTAAVSDAWGNYWDQLERTALRYDEARVACESFGGRLPTATESHRVSTARTGLFDSSNTNEIWTLAPSDATQQATMRLSSGAVEAEPTANNLPYRCVCPVESPLGFNGSDCSGPVGSECFSSTSNQHLQVDSLDRPAMRKNSAIWECAWSGGHLADLPRLVETIVEGLPNGTNTYLHTADDGHHNNSSAIRWNGTVSKASWAFASDLHVVNTDLNYPFRCAGRADQPGAHPAEFAGSYTTANDGYTADAADRPAPACMPSPGCVWKTIHDACWDRGGHLARSGELGELILDGLPGGSNSWLYTADQTGYDGAQFTVAVMRWVGVVRRFTYAYGAGTFTWAYKHANTYPYRCVYYPLDSAFTPPSSCNGGACTSFTLPGDSGATMVFDSSDRAAATWINALDDCRDEGADLASERDLTEAIRHGLPNGTSNWVWTSDFGWGSYGVNFMIVNWQNPETDFDDFYSTHMTWDGPNMQRQYRCMWTNELR